jgi:aryl-alcohol dehydrogenase-like predicted oxidoreductase
MNFAWAYGPPIAEAAAEDLLLAALDLGYDHFDTANIYGLGRSERVMGRALRARRGEFLLASKMGIVIDGERRGIDCSPAAIRECLDQSLARLQTDHIDLYYLHRFDPKVPIADMIGTLADLIHDGKIGAIGVSEWSAAHIREAHAVHPLAAVQTEYSPWTRNVEIAVLDTCAELDIALVAFSPVARGFLAGAVSDPEQFTPQDIRRTMPRFAPEHWAANHALAQQFNALAATAGVTPAQLSLAWVLSRGAHVHAIPGTSSRDHLGENIVRSDWRPDPELLARVDALINQGTVSGHRYSEAMQRTIDTEDYPLATITE